MLAQLSSSPSHRMQAAIYSVPYSRREAARGLSLKGAFMNAVVGVKVARCGVFVCSRCETARGMHRPSIARATSPQPDELPRPRCMQLSTGDSSNIGPCDMQRPCAANTTTRTKPTKMEASMRPLCCHACESSMHEQRAVPDRRKHTCLGSHPRATVSAQCPHPLLVALLLLHQ